jgi:spore maturation protein SpmA
MALNYIWVAFFLIAFVVSLVQWLVFQDNTIFERVMSASFDSAKNAVMVIALPLAGIMTLWLGILNIGEKAGAIRFLSRIVGPFFSKLFPEIPKNHPAGGQLLMNFSATMLGLDNAATPMGLKAMQSLQELNPDKDTASNAQIMFLALNTAGMTIIPINIIAQRAIMGSANPTDVFIPILIATFVATLSAILFVGVRQKLNLLNRTVLGWIGGITFLLGSLVWWFSTMSRAEMANASSILSNVTIFGIIVTFICGALYKRINVWEAFIDGAKGGFETSVKIIPYLVGMLVGVAVFRASGAMELVTDGIKFIISSIGLNVDFVDALPTAFMKPLSGSGARGMMLDTMKIYGADSFVGHLSCLFQGAADTTFYIVALYFGSVGIKRTRYAIWAGLLADAAGALAAIFLAYAFFK